MCPSRRNRPPPEFRHVLRPARLLHPIIGAGNLPGVQLGPGQRMASQQPMAPPVFDRVEFA